MKNAKQAARKQANIQAAEERLARLKRVQETARQLRATFGYRGNDGDVIALHSKATETAQERFVNIALYACKGTSRVLQRYMSHSLRLSLDRQAYLIQEFLGRPQNKGHRDIVNAKVLESDSTLLTFLRVAA
jgi:hypothetical protein